MKNLSIKQQDNYNIIKLRNDLSQNEYLQMRSYINDHFLKKGQKKIVMDCEQTAQLPSIAFGVFCSINRDIKRVGGSYCLIHVSSFNQQIMARTHMDKQVKYFSTLQDAIDNNREPES